MTEIPFWPVTIPSKTTGVVIPQQSIAPPSMTVNFPSNVDLVPVTKTNYSAVGFGPGPTGPSTITSPPGIAATTLTTPTPYPANMKSGCTGFYKAQKGDSCWSIENAYGIAASDFDNWNPDVGTNCANGVWLGYYYCVAHDGSAYLSTSSSNGDKEKSMSFGITSHIITIKPGATYTTIPPATTIPPIKFKSKNKKHDNKDKDNSDHSYTDNTQCVGCGSLDCSIWGCGGGCGIFGCDGGCGIWWCGGGCALDFCGPGCGSTGESSIVSIDGCSSNSTVYTGGCIQSGGGGGTAVNQPQPKQPDQCTTMATASICTVIVRTYSTTGMPSSSVTTSVSLYWSISVWGKGRR